MARDHPHPCADSIIEQQSGKPRSILLQRNHVTTDQSRVLPSTAPWLTLPESADQRKIDPNRREILNPYQPEARPRPSDGSHGARLPVGQSPLSSIHLVASHSPADWQRDLSGRRLGLRRFLQRRLQQRAALCRVYPRTGKQRACREDTNAHLTEWQGASSADGRSPWWRVPDGWNAVR